MTTGSAGTPLGRDVTRVVRGTNQSGLRAHNERLVLTLLRYGGPMAKAEIARITGLSAQTISVIMRRLEDDGLLERGEPVRGRVGQPSTPMHLAAGGVYSFGLKIGRRSVDLVLIDFLGNVVDRVHRAHPYPTPGGILEFTTEAVAQLRQTLTADQQRRISGLGIAMPFRLWDWATSIGAPVPEMMEWKTRDIQAELAARHDFPVYLQNDASAACGAELVFGTGERPRDFLYLFIGYFIGGGLVLNDTLHVGPTGNAGAIGSLPIPALGGAHLQLVDVASLAVLEQAMRAADLPAGVLWQRPERWSGSCDIQGEFLETWIRESCQGMAYAVAAAASVLDIEAVMIDGWIPAKLRARLVLETRRALAHLDISGIDKPDIREGTIGPDGRALGAASLPLQDRYMVDQNALIKPE